jgi:uridine kinase
VSGDEPPRDLLGLLASRAPHNAAYPIVVIDGRGASGKSTLATLLLSVLTDVVVVSGDDYFERHDDPVTWGAFNEERFDTDVLSALRSGRRTISLQPHDFSRSGLTPPLTHDVRAGVVVERCFGFGLSVEWDVRIWVETPRAVCLERGIRRDATDELGDRVVRAWEDVWQPREDEYIRQFRPQEKADIVVDGTLPFEGQLGVPD